MKKIALMVLLCFTASCIIAPANAGYYGGYGGGYGYGGPSENYGYGGKWVTEDRSKSNLAWPIVVGVISILAFTWLWKKGPDPNRQQQVVVPTTPQEQPLYQQSPAPSPYQPPTFQPAAYEYNVTDF